MNRDLPPVFLFATEPENMNVVVSENSKICIQCHENLLLSSFHRKASYWDSRCKICASHHKKNYYLSKKRRKKTDYSNIVVRYYDELISTKNNDLFSLLESFLFEELVDEHSVNA